MTQSKQELQIQTVQIEDLRFPEKNPRKWSESATEGLKESVRRFGIVDPVLLNSAKGRENVILGGRFRIEVAKELGYTEIPAVHVHIDNPVKERELILRLNKHHGNWNIDILKEFDVSLLEDIGFSSEELDEIFIDENIGETFDIQKELKKLDITKVEAKKGDVYQLGDSRLMVGDSTVPEDFAKLMNGEQADLCLCDPPYRLSYMKGGIRHGEPVTGFGAKRNRRYLETEELPEDFTPKWMQNVADHAKEDFSIIVYEAWHNLREIWSGLEAHWKVKNMLVWHLPNRHQGFAAKYKFFSKYDIAMVGASGTVEYNHEEEPDGLQEEYETALYAISGKPQWEGYQKGKDKRFMPTDFIEFNADDEKHSGQNIIFGTKPIEILLPYIKVLTRRGDLVVEPFCGSGSTLIAATKLHRRCYVMEKSPVYAEVAMKRWEKLTGQKRVKLDETDKS